MGRFHLPTLGAGLGYRSQLLHLIMQHKNRIDWLELITEHFILTTKERMDHAVELAAHFPLSPHGLELSIGTAGPLDEPYVEAVAALVRRVNAPWFSDHLAFTRTAEAELGQLTPLHFTKENVRLVAEKARYLQDRVGVPFLLENITYYFELEGEMDEATFIRAVLEEADCGMLLDVTNVFINCANRGRDPFQFVESLPRERIVQLHVVGAEKRHGSWLDTHADPVSPEIWELTRYVCKLAPVKAILLERDFNFPNDPEEILRELDTAREIMRLSH